MQRTAFAEALRERRIRASLSQEALAELAAMSVQAVSALERGARSRPYKDTVTRLANALDLSEAELDEFQAAAQAKPRVRGTNSIGVSQTRLGELLPLVGRDEEVRNLSDALESGTRFITIVGPAGVGKSSVARAAGSHLHCGRCDGHAIVELEDATTVDRVFAAIAGAIQVSETQDSFEAVAAALGSRRMLLVLDNCDRVLHAGSRIVELLLRCPQLNVLVTSREPLHVRGETIVRLEPLEEEDARTLFVHCAQRASRDFCVSEENNEDLVAVLRSLDGLPLAIELAAARLTTISFEDLCERTASPFGAPFNASGVPKSRHSTMESAIAWSFEALSESERRAFLQIAALPPACHADAVLAAFTATGVDPEDARRAFESLIDKHLVKRSKSANGEAYVDMLSVVRDFGARLVTDEPCITAYEGHARWYAAYAAGAAPRLAGRTQHEWMSRLKDNMPNLRRAFALFVEKRDARAALSLAVDLCEYYDRAGAHGEARTRLETALGIAQSSAERFPNEIAAALLACGRTAIAQCDMQAAHQCFADARHLLSC